MEAGAIPNEHWGLARPVPPETAHALVVQIGALMAAATLGGSIVHLRVDGLVEHPALLWEVTGLGIVLATALVVAGSRRAAFVHRRFSAIVYGLFVGAPVLISLAQYAVGPLTLMVVVLYVEVPIFAVYLLPRQVAAAVVALEAIEFGVVLAIQDGYPAPALQWFFLATALLSIGVIFGGMLRRAGEEATRLGRLRRFLSPEVAEMVMSSGHDVAIRPHRRRISVVFCDLRGFTRFAAGSEPEDVVEVLEDYYTAVGTVITEVGATTGGFSGDGIMAYFNDPVPCDDPAARALELIGRLHEPLHTLVRAWRRRGIHLSYGLGVAYGYATLGVVGFEGRSDYTAMGSVVNLASRLSDEAGPGEVLMDERIFGATEGIDAEACELQLKGFADPVTAYRVAAFGDAAPRAGARWNVTPTPSG